MARAIYNLGSLIAAVAVIVAMWPFALFGGIARLWSAIELKVVYKGDAAARDKATWKDRV